MIERWIIDASPLILLGKAGQLDWLPQMGRIVVPESVATEVAAGSPVDPARQWLAASEGAACIVPDLAPTSDLLAWDLGAGETAVIAMAMANPGHEAVLDDAAARRCAMVFGVTMRGTLSFVALSASWRSPKSAALYLSAGRSLIKCWQPVSISHPHWWNKSRWPRVNDAIIPVRHFCQGLPF